MTGRKTIVGLGLFCALLFSAFAAQSASALGTTAFTCKPSTGVVGFSDEHCDKAAPKETATFSHAEIAAGTKTDVEVTNGKTASSTTASTNAVMEIKGLFGIAKVTITCKKVGNGPTTSYFENKAGPPMSAEGTVDLTYTECTQTGLGLKCFISSKDHEEKVTPTGTVTAGTIGKTITPSEATMGIEFTSDNANGNFTTFVFTGEGCAFAGQEAPVKGSVVGTPGGTANGAGATLVVTPATSKLTVGGKEATLSQTTTTRMTESGNPIVLTTTNP
jgi:hypothetical protein